MFTIRFPGLGRATALKLVTLASLVLLTTGCASNRSVLDVNVDSGANPTGGEAVYFVKISDSRAFEQTPKDPSTPSLKGGDIGNVEITSRAIARKRGSYGNAWGDVVLPEGRTVSELVGSAMARAFRDAGYQVIEGGDPRFPDAIPVEASIENFWAWMTPGFWALALESKTKVYIKAPITSFRTGEAVEGYARDTFQVATEGNWREIVERGIANFIQNLKSRLPPGENL